MGVLKHGLLLVLVCLSTRCSSRARSEASPPASDEHLVETALAFEAKGRWAEAEQTWNRFALPSRYFGRAFLETQKLSYRRENWNVLFAKAELYKSLFHDSFVCPELYLLQAFALLRNCYFDDAEASLKSAVEENNRQGLSRCRAADSSFADQVSELRSVLQAQRKIKIPGRDVRTDAFQRNLWPTTPAVLARIKQLPIDGGLALVAVKVTNHCGWAP